MAKFGTEARVGTVVLVGILIFIYGTMQVTHLGEKRGYELHADFKNGLPESMCYGIGDSTHVNDQESVIS